MVYYQENYADYKGKGTKISYCFKKRKCLEAVCISIKIAVVFSGGWDYEIF